MSAIEPDRLSSIRMCASKHFVTVGIVNTILVVIRSCLCCLPCFLLAGQVAVLRLWSCIFSHFGHILITIKVACSNHVSVNSFGLWVISLSFWVDHGSEHIVCQPIPASDLGSVAICRLLGLIRLEMHAAMAYMLRCMTIMSVYMLYLESRRKRCPHASSWKGSKILGQHPLQSLVQLLSTNVH